ncbi:MAG: hypothetical protein ACHQVS_00565 [Candidatus Babeliales bacterium]
MPQIINNVGRAAMFGQQFGQGLGEGLSALAEYKLQQVQQRNNVNRLADVYKSLGADENTARGLAALPQEIQKSYLERGGAATWGQGGQQVAQSAQQSGVYAPSALEQPQQQQFAPPSETQAIRQRLSALNPNQPEQEQEALLNKIRSPEQRRQAFREQGIGLPEQQPSAAQFGRGIQQAPPQQAPQAAPGGAPAAPQKGSIGEVLARPSFHEQQLNRRHEEAMGQKERHFQAKEQKELRKESEGFRKEVLDIHHADIADRARLKKILSIDKKNNVINPQLYATLKEHGFATGSVLNADTQELAKLSTDMFTNFKKMFPRGTNIDAQIFEQRIPSLMNSREGRERVIGNMLKLTDLNEKIYDEMQNVIKDNGGNVPPLFQEEVYKRVDPYVKDWEQDFVNMSQENAPQVGQGFDKLPPANSLPKNTELFNDVTGKYFVTNGKNWRVV